MPCYRPLHGFLAAARNPSGKRSIVFDKSAGLSDRPVDVPCGRCIGCRLERSRVWAMRCTHEAAMHDHNCFITLTYRGECIPQGGTLVPKHFQDFMKRLRKLCRTGFSYVNSNGDVRSYQRSSGIRYYHCGEYGDQLSRPHYHACIFGFNFPDKVLWSIRDGVRLYRSKTLEALWPFGFSTIGDVTYESAAYIARYCVKKISGDAKVKHYNGRHPEYATMSLKPGIGFTWFEKYASDVVVDDSVIVRGCKSKPPKFYLDKYNLTNPKEVSKIKSVRKFKAKNDPHNSQDRLLVREQVKLSQFKQLNRSLENET